MKMIIAVLLLTLSAVNPAQITAQHKATKFDEFGDILSSDLKARLDNYAIELQNQATSKGFLVVYRSRRDLPGLNLQLALRMKDYLTASRGLDKSRIVTVDAGVAACLSQQLWIVPPGTAPEVDPHAQISYLSLRDEAWQFGSYYFVPPYVAKKIQ